MASPVGFPVSLQEKNNSDSSDDDGVPTIRSKKRIQTFSDSDSDVNKDAKQEKEQSDSGSDGEVSKSISVKSRTKIILQDDSDSDSYTPKSKKNKEQQIRMKNKHSKIKEKFKSLLKSRTREDKTEDDLKIKENYICQDDSEDMSSIDNIKKIIKEKTFMPSLCDPDTSDEENSEPRKKSAQKREKKSIKATSPKPMRMSAKEAMENMHKIKSESNRMLREKQVSLPYHRPKALTLKDIMSRRKPALGSEGKALSIKMSETQLREYALLLEQRQKEMMELCKSDTDDELDNDDTPLESETANSNVEESTDKTSTPEDNNINEQQSQETDKPSINDIEDLNVLKETTNLHDLNCEINYNVDGNKDDNHINNDLDGNPNNSEGDDSSINKKENKSVDQESEEINEQNIQQDVRNTVNMETEPESQLIDLHYDSESVRNTETLAEINTDIQDTDNGNIKELQENEERDFTFSDEDFDVDDIDKLIENTDIKETEDAENLVKDSLPSNVRPKLSGAPGLVIDLENIDTAPTKKLTGVEMLMERFSFSAGIKTTMENENNKEKILKSGVLRRRLKEELIDQLAENRSLEWAKRLEKEKQLQAEIKELRGEESDAEEDIEKMEMKLEEKEIAKEVEEESSSSEEELLEDDIIIKDKPRTKNDMIDDEAEESDDENDKNNDKIHESDGENNDDGDHEDEDTDSSDDSESSEDETTNVTRKGRILKAFEDSDDEDNKVDNEGIHPVSIENDQNLNNYVESETYTQDDEIQSAQTHKPEDLFTSQEIDNADNSKENENFKDNSLNEENNLGVLSIASKCKVTLSDTETNNEIINTQPFVDDNLIPITESSLGTISQSILPSQLPTQLSQSQPIGDDILALCTGKFYDNEFISPDTQGSCDSQELQFDVKCDDEENVSDKNKTMHSAELVTKIKDTTEDTDNIGIKENVNVNILYKTKIDADTIETSNIDKCNEKPETNSVENNKISDIESVKDSKHKSINEDTNLKNILDELNDPDFDLPKSKCLDNNTQKNNGNTLNVYKKKFVIDSDDEANDDVESKRKKKLKKRKPEQRALQISDDEEDAEDEEEYISELEEEENDRLVEYDSEENEVEVNVQPKKKRKVADFFEQEAELTSEDEWIGSGDEDEAGLDKMEREEGDDEQFNQKQLQRELEQIHMRDVLDQDKREVRIIQELLFEDGDLGTGSRQRQFRWKNADGEEETGAIHDFTDTQEEEFESEEQWRKERHEREVFLRQLGNGDEDASLEINVNMTSIIKGNVSKSDPGVILANNKGAEATSSVKKCSKNILIPKKPFAVIQHNYHGSLLTRGRGALARLAALATPLAVDDDAKMPIASSSKRNFVFAALSQEETKVSKRKADNVDTTPKLVKKMKLEEKQKYMKNSLLDRLKV